MSSPYKVQTYGRCKAGISGADECSAAAADLSLADVTAADDQQAHGVSWDPDGCYFESGKLKHHRHGLNTGACSVFDKCLCTNVGTYQGKPQSV